MLLVDLDDSNNTSNSNTSNNNTSNNNTSNNNTSNSNTSNNKEMSHRVEHWFPPISLLFESVKVEELELGVISSNMV
jgi:hypothetical protein